MIIAANRRRIFLLVLLVPMDSAHHGYTAEFDTTKPVAGEIVLMRRLAFGIARPHRRQTWEGPKSLDRKPSCGRRRRTLSLSCRMRRRVRTDRSPGSGRDRCGVRARRSRRARRVSRSRTHNSRKSRRRSCGLGAHVSGDGIRCNRLHPARAATACLCAIAKQRMRRLDGWITPTVNRVALPI